MALSIFGHFLPYDIHGFSTTLFSLQDLLVSELLDTNSCLLPRAEACLASTQHSIS